VHLDRGSVAHREGEVVAEGLVTRQPVLARGPTDSQR
jgi:hypothetical protein